MGYIIQLGSWQSVFAVPADIVDKHMRLAGSAQLKTILYILRHSGKPFDAALLSRELGLDESDAQDALDYWVNCGLLEKNGTALAPKSYVNTETPQVGAKPIEPAAPVCKPAAPIAEAASETKKSNPTPKRREHIRYSYDECVGMIAEDDELPQMLRVLEGIMNKQLNHSEISVFVTLAKWYGMETSCVCMLAEYCRSIGKGTIGYIETTGEEWVKEDILTVERADEKISKCRAVNSAWGHIRSLLDIPMRAPTNAEKQCSFLWIEEMAVDDSLIKLAYDRCVDRKGKMSFPYMRGIIEKWHKNGILNAEQAIASESEYEASTKKEKHTKKETNSGTYARTYDLDELENTFDNWPDDLQ